MLKVFHGCYLLVAESIPLSEVFDATLSRIVETVHTLRSMRATATCEAANTLLRFQSTMKEVCQEKNCIIDDVNKKPKPSPDFGKCVHQLDQPLSTPHKDRSWLLRVARSDAGGRQTLLGRFSMDGDEVVFESFALAVRSRYAAEAASAMVWRSICRCIDRACGNPLPESLEMGIGVIGPYSLFWWQHTANLCRTMQHGSSACMSTTGCHKLSMLSGRSQQQAFSLFFLNILRPRLDASRLRASLSMGGTGL